jgi:hypothetical protein
MPLKKWGKTLLTRMETAAYLGRSKQSVIGLEQRGRLRPIKGRSKNPKEPVLYDRDEVDTVLLREPNGKRAGVQSGELCAKCFEAFRAGKSDADIVIALRVPIEYVRAARVDYDPLAIMLDGAVHMALRQSLGSMGHEWQTGAELATQVEALCQEYISMQHQFMASPGSLS